MDLWSKLSEISGRQQPMKNFIFEHLKEDMTLICGNQTTAINIDFVKTCGNNMKSLPSTFQVVIHFHRSHLQLKTLANSFRALI